MPRITSRRTSRSPATLILGVMLLLVIGAVSLNWDKVVSFISNKTVLEEKSALEDQLTLLKQKNRALENKLATTSQASLNQQEWQTSNDIEKAPAIDLNQKTCEQLDNKIQSFFGELDEKDYIQAYNLKTNSHEHFTILIDKLISNPPIVVRETDSLFTILTNTAHFYRILGKDNLLLIKDIVTRESESLELLLAHFDQWSRSGHTCENALTKIDLPLKGLYEYAGFFTNTLGGQAYLFRRESNLRLLISYYCIMVLDRANAQIVNRHGINIIPPLNSLVKEMELSETLIYRDQYLRILHNLQDKYQANSVAENTTAVNEEQ